MEQGTHRPMHWRRLAARLLVATGAVLSLATHAYSIPPAMAQSPAPAPDRVKAAAEEFDSGRRAFKAQDWTSAAEHFENAMHDVPTPEAMRLAIRARKNAHQDGRAATLAAMALVRYPEDKATVALSKQILQQVRNSLHKVDVTCKPACSLVVDGHITPLGEVESAVLFLEPGSHAVSAGWSSERNVSNTIAAKAFGSSDMSFEAPPLPPPPDVAPKATVAPPPPPPPKGVLPPSVFYIAAGATVLAGSITLWSGLDMVASPGKDRVRIDCAGKDDTCPTYQDALSSQRRTNILLGVTGGLAVGTAVVGLFLTRWGSPQPATRTGSSVTPVIGLNDGLTVGAAGRF